MATLYSTQFSNGYVDVPRAKINSPDFNGLPRYEYFEYPLPSVAPSANDVIKACKIPKGARIVDAGLSYPDLGTTGVLELGWAASAELSSGSAVEAASASGLLASVDVNAAAVGCINMVPKTGAAVAGYLKKFSAEVDVEIKVTTAWTSTTTTDKIKGYVAYIL